MAWYYFSTTKELSPNMEMACKSLQNLKKIERNRGQNNINLVGGKMSWNNKKVPPYCDSEIMELMWEIISIYRWSSEGKNCNIINKLTFALSNKQIVFSTPPPPISVWKSILWNKYCNCAVHFWPNRFHKQKKKEIFVGYRDFIEILFLWHACI